mgnify:CR=1 FL=1
MSGDYFGRPDSSLACSFSPQGLFRPPGFIPSLLFFSTGIISIGQIHLQPALFLHRDYFYRPDSSLACFFSPQGLFLSASFIPSLLFFPTGIISTAWIHPQPALFLHRDYFFRPDSSLSCSFLPQGLFRPPGFIPGLLFSSAGIISAARIHPQPALLFRRDYSGRPDSSPACSFSHRDYFYRSDSSLACSFVPQGLFRPPGFIPTGRFPPLRMHLCKVSL